MPESDLAHSFPVVITIDSDSDKEIENIEFDSSITWTGTTQINEKENDFPSSFLEMIECEDIERVSKETGIAAKNYSFTTTRRVLDGHIRNAEIEL